MLQSRGLVGTDDENVGDVENGVGRVLNKAIDFAVDVPMYHDGDNVSVDDWFGNRESKPDTYMGVGWMNEMKDELVVDADRRKLKSLRGDEYPSAYLAPPSSKRLKTIGDVSTTMFAQMPSVQKRGGVNDESNGVDDNNDTKTRVYVTRSTAKQIKVEEL